MAKFPDRMQGAQLPNLSVTWTDENGNARALTGTLTGYMTAQSTNVTKAIAGTLTADSDQVNNTGVFTWDIDAADVATADVFSVYFVETVSGEDYKSEPTSWAILEAPTP